MKAARIVKPKDPLEVHELEIPKPKGSQILVKVQSSFVIVISTTQLLRRRARVVLVGLFGGGLKLNLLTMPTKTYSIIGCYTGTLRI